MVGVDARRIQPLLGLWVFAMGLRASVFSVCEQGVAITSFTIGEEGPVVTLLDVGGNGAHYRRK